MRAGHRLWGATIAATVDSITSAATDTPVVQICGAVPGLESGTGSTETAVRLAERVGGPLFPLPAPVFASRSVRDELLANVDVLVTDEAGARASLT